MSSAWGWFLVLLLLILVMWFLEKWERKKRTSRPIRETNWYQGNIVEDPDSERPENAGSPTRSDTAPSDVGRVDPAENVCQQVKSRGNVLGSGASTPAVNSWSRANTGLGILAETAADQAALLPATAVCPSESVLPAVALSDQFIVPKSKISKGQLHACKVLQQELNTQLKWNDRSNTWNKNPETNRNLELDCWSPSHKVALEFQGGQHTRFPNGFHKNVYEFKKSIQRDLQKKANCEANDVYLIEVHEGTKEAEAERLIKEHLHYWRSLKTQKLVCDARGS